MAGIISPCLHVFTVLVWAGLVDSFYVLFGLALYCTPPVVLLSSQVEGSAISTAVALSCNLSYEKIYINNNRPYSICFLCCGVVFFQLIVTEVCIARIS